MFNPISSLLDV